MSGYQAILQLSALAGFWGAYASNALIGSASPLQWQLPIAVQLVPGVLLLLGTMLVPESPRFLAERGRYQAAEHALSWLRSVPIGQLELECELEEVREAARISKMLGENQKSFLSEVLKKGVRKRLVVGVGLMIAQNMVGLNALNYCTFLCPWCIGNLLIARNRCPRDLHVRRIHIRIFITLPHWSFWCSETTLCYRFHVHLHTH